MTPANRLRSLVKAATPGRIPDALNQISNFASQDRDIVLARARLIALAPQLAELVAEQHEALSWTLSSLDTVLQGRPHRAIPEMRACSEAALARLAALFPEDSA